MSFDRVTFTDDAVEDLKELRRQDQRLVVEALRIAKRIDDGTICTKQLDRYTKTGDLTDCSRAYFGATADGDSHRIVLRDVGGEDPAAGAEASRIEVVEVVAVAERANDVAYLLTALRLGRLDSDPVRKADAQRTIARARKGRRKG